MNYTFILDIEQHIMHTKNKKIMHKNPEGKYINTCNCSASERERICLLARQALPKSIKTARGGWPFLRVKRTLPGLTSLCAYGGSRLCMCWSPAHTCQPISFNNASNHNMNAFRPTSHWHCNRNIQKFTQTWYHNTHDNNRRKIWRLPVSSKNKMQICLYIPVVI